MNEIFLALIGAAGSCIGTVVGIFVNTKLINYRLEKLEEKVNRHNNLIERTYELEIKERLVEEKIETLHHRIDELNDNVKIYSDNKFLKEV